MYTLYYKYNLDNYLVKEHQQVMAVTRLHCQQELIIMLQLMQNFLTKNVNPIKCYMLLSGIECKIYYLNELKYYYLHVNI